MTYEEMQLAVVALQPGENIDLGQTELWFGALLSHLRRLNDCGYRRKAINGRVIIERQAMR
jgi:hypothetical protein